MARCNTALEVLNKTATRKNETERLHCSSVVACLYQHLNAVTEVRLKQVVKEVSAIRASQVNRILALEQARNSVLPSAHTSMASNVLAEHPHSEAFYEENAELLRETETDLEGLQTTQRTLSELTAMLSFFSQKLMEQEELSERSEA
jgi:hypothetical protein